jgi:hypothetical protein
MLFGWHRLIKKGQVSMTPDEFKEKMAALYEANARETGWMPDVPGKAEIAHKAADELLCECLRQLGYGEGVDIYKSKPKWYE